MHENVGKSRQVRERHYSFPDWVGKATSKCIAFDKKLHISHAYYNVTLQANYYAPHVTELIYKIAKLDIGN